MRSLILVVAAFFSASALADPRVVCLFDFNGKAVEMEQPRPQYFVLNDGAPEFRDMEAEVTFFNWERVSVVFENTKTNFRFFQQSRPMAIADTARGGPLLSVSFEEGKHPHGKLIEISCALKTD